MSTPSPTDILAENLLSDEEHKSLDVNTSGLLQYLGGHTEPARLAILVQHIMIQAPQKTNIRTLSPEEVQRILIDERVFKIVQEAEQLQTFRNVRNLGKSLSRDKRFNYIKSPYQLHSERLLSSLLM